MSETYVAREKRLHCLIGLLAGGALLFFGLDMHFFHTLSSQVGTKHPIWIILSAVGGLIILGSLKALVAPKTLLLADSNGITLFSGGSAKVWNEKTKSFDTTRRKGEAKVIPWATVVGIGEGTILTGQDEVGGTKVTIAGGRTRVGGKTRYHKAKALKILCDREIKLEGFDIFGISKAWNGYEDADLQQMSKADREKLTADDLNSGFVFKHTHLRGGLKGALAALTEMHKRLGQPEN